MSAIRGGHSSDHLPMLSGGLASAAARVVNQFCQLAIFIVGARVLGPSQFGVFALASVFAILTLQFTKAGTLGFILSLRGPDHEVRQALAVSVALSMAGLATGLIVAHVTSAWSNTPDLGELIALFAVWVALSTYGDAQFAILTRNGRLVATAACEAVAEIAGMVIAISLLRMKVGPEALVFGRLATQCIIVVWSNALTMMVPTLSVSRRVASRLYRSSLNILSAQVLNNVQQSLTTILIGGFLGASAVGHFRGAQRLTGAVAELACEPFRAVAWVYFRHATAGHAEAGSAAMTANLQRAMEWLVPLLFVISGPLFIGLAIMAEPIVDLILGNAWHESAPLISILSLAALLKMPATFTVQLLTFVDRIKALPPISLLNAALSLLFVFPACLFGVMEVAWAQFAAAIVAIATTIWLQQRFVGIDWRAISLRLPLLVLPLVLMSCTAYVMRNHIGFHVTNSVIALAVTVLVSAMLYTGAIMLLRRDLVIALMAAVRSKPRSPRSGELPAETTPQ
ncbi:MAG: oligosaccharide flippase family protein [Hyphomicrobiaceae bacterium]